MATFVVAAVMLPAEFSTAGETEMVCILFPFKINAVFKKTAADLLSAIASTGFVFVDLKPSYSLFSFATLQFACLMPILRVVFVEIARVVPLSFSLVVHSMCF